MHLASLQLARPGLTIPRATLLLLLSSRLWNTRNQNQLRHFIALCLGRTADEATLRSIPSGFSQSPFPSPTVSATLRTALSKMATRNRTLLTLACVACFLVGSLPQAAAQLGGASKPRNSQTLFEGLNLDFVAFESWKLLPDCFRRCLGSLI